MGEVAVKRGLRTPLINGEFRGQWERDGEPSLARLFIRGHRTDIQGRVPRKVDWSTKEGVRFLQIWKSKFHVRLTSRSLWWATWETVVFIRYSGI